MLAKIARGVSSALFGNGSTPPTSEPLYSLPQLPRLKFSEQVVKNLNKQGGIPTDEEVKATGALDKFLKKGAKNAQKVADHNVSIAQSEQAIAKAYEKGRIAAQKSQVAQSIIQAKGYHQANQIITAGEEAIAKAGGGEL